MIHKLRFPIGGLSMFSSIFEELPILKRNALNAFMDRLKELEGDNLLQVTLFASLDRSPNIDLFILLKNLDAKTRGRILGFASDIEEIYQRKINLSPFIRSEKTYLENREKSLMHSEKINGVIIYAKNHLDVKKDPFFEIFRFSGNK
ncbi:MAG: hypothetical protein LBO82_00580 [Synergistaceae bacterium]|jgi:hypothetical protein|nr:hypothetical protein [Synergistaceae bacterium]